MGVATTLPELSEWTLISEGALLLASLYHFGMPLFRDWRIHIDSF